MKLERDEATMLGLNLKKTFITVFFACVLAPATALAGDVVDTRVTFTLGDDNFLKSAGEQVPDSPRLGIGDREGYQAFFDNLNQATSGRENLFRFVLYKKADGIFPRLTTEAAAAMKVDLTELSSKDPKLPKAFGDDSSYIRLAYLLSADKASNRNLDVVLFPLTGDRFRVGYLYALTWGGTDMFPRRKGATPAFKLGGNHGKFYWWAGSKMVQSDTAPKESKDEQGLTITTQNSETFYSALAGTGVMPVDGLSIDLSGAHVQMGENPVKDVAGELVTATGASGRIAYGKGLKVMLSSDLKLLRNDPEFIEGLSIRPKYNYDGQVSWSVGAEGNAISQVLANPDKYGATKRQLASAAALDFRMQRNSLRLNVTALYRSLQFILLSTPSFVPFTAMSKDMTVQSELFGAVSADYHFPRFGLTPGIQAGVEMPAAVKTELYATSVGSNPTTNLVGTHTMVIRANGRPDILPEGDKRMPLYSVRLNTAWWASQMMTLQAFAFITYDQNSTILQMNADQTKTRVFEDPLRFGAGLMAQSRF